MPYWLIKINDMKTFGIMLIVIGIAMVLFLGFSITSEKDTLGPLQVGKENKGIGWPTYAGALITLGGVVVLTGDKKRA